MDMLRRLISCRIIIIIIIITHRRQSWIQHGGHGLCKVDCQPCRFGPVHTDWQQSRSYRQQSWMYRQQIPPRQAVKFTLLWIYCQSQQHSWTYRQQSLTYTSTVDFVADVLNSRLSTKSTVLNSTLLPVCTWLKSTTWFQLRRRY